jgi:hypothetical protein
MASADPAKDLNNGIEPEEENKDSESEKSDKEDSEENSDDSDSEEKKTKDKKEIQEEKEEEEIPYCGPNLLSWSHKNEKAIVPPEISLFSLQSKRLQMLFNIQNAEMIKSFRDA